MILVQDFTLDLAGLKNVLGERRKDSFRPQIKPQSFDPSNQTALAMSHGREARGSNPSSHRKPGHPISSYM